MSESWRVMLVGAGGRMGRAIATAAADENDVLISPRIEEADAVIDFSHADATARICELCARHGKPLVLGTTGHADAQFRPVQEAATAVPIVFAPNFSVGVNTLFWLTRKAAELLGSDFDAEIVEMHHRLKKDAPSGTAKKLAEIVAEARSVAYEAEVRHGRSGMVGARTATEIGMHALRGGDVVGDHTVIFAGPGERVELTHRASSRHTFARGALRAARWVVTQPPGLYSMQDVLGLTNT